MFNKVIVEATHIYFVVLVLYYGVEIGTKIVYLVSHVLANCSVTFCESFLLVLRFMVSD